MVGNVHASSCPPSTCQVAVSSNVPSSDGTIWVQIDNGTYSANTGNYCQTNSCIVPLPQASPPTFSFGYNTNHTLSILNANTTFTGQSTNGHYVWREWDIFYGTSSRTRWTGLTNLNIGPVQYNYTGSAGFTAVFDKQYAATLSFTDANGSPLSPAPASVTLQPQGSSSTITITNYSGQYLSASVYTATVAHWEGVDTPPTTSTQSFDLTNGPTTGTISIKAYPETVRIVDSNNSPVRGANVTITFVNATSRSYVSDSNGNVKLGDIPQGTFAASVNYQNQLYGPYSMTAINSPTNTIQVNAGNSSTAATTTAIVLLAIFAIAFFLILLAIKVRKPAAPPSI